MTKIWAAMMSLLLLLAACAPASTSTPAAPASADPTPTAESASTGGAAQTMAAWMRMPLVNARTGETFTFADFSGKTVLARTVGVW